MTVRVGLMGFGRVGRNIFRLLYKRNDIEVAAVSDIAEPKSLEYLLKYDTILGRFPDGVAVKDGFIHTCGKQIPLLAGRAPGDVKWGELGVDVVIEATARPRSRQEVTKHLDMGAKKVVLCVPSTDAPDITVVMGVNHQDLQAKHRIISNASITAHSVIPLMSILQSAFGIERVFYTAVHAYTGDQHLADVPANNLRGSRAATENIIPTETKSTKLFEDFIAPLQNKISGMALKVPVMNGSLVDMVTYTTKPISVDAVNEAVRAAAAAQYSNIIEYSTDPIVSSDVKQSPYSCTYDSMATMALGTNAVKTIAWYDNGWGYANRAIDLVQHIAKLEGGLQ